MTYHRTRASVSRTPARITLPEGGRVRRVIDDPTAFLYNVWLPRVSADIRR